MSTQILTSPLGPETNQPQGNFLSKKIFDSDDYHKLIDRYGINEDVTTWDVSAPIIDNRPVIDDTLVSGAKRERVHLGISTNQEKGTLIISISDLHKSKTDTNPRNLDAPIIGDSHDSVFALDSDKEGSYSALVVSMDKTTGKIDFVGTNEKWEAEVLFSGSSMSNPDYERCANLVQRMLAVPLVDNAYRKPIDTLWT